MKTEQRELQSFLSTVCVVLILQVAIASHSGASAVRMQ